MNNPSIKSVTAAILINDGLILIAKRKSSDPLANKWEFPGGTIEKGETPEECLRREMKEEFDIDVTVGEYFGESTYHYDHGSIKLLAYRTYWVGGKITMQAHDDYQWVHMGRLGQYDFASADIPLVEEVMNHEW